jgi:hypothetical protein
MSNMRIQASLVLFAGLAFCSGAAATVDSGPYQAIVTRNVFALKDPAPPRPTIEEAKPAPKLILTGITTFGRSRALLKAAPGSPKPGEQPNGGESFILGEGERQGEVQVVSIDPAMGKVTLNIGGESVTIGFADNSRSKGGPVGTPAASSPGFSGPLPPKQFTMAGNPQSQPAQSALPVQAVAFAPAAAAQPQVQTDSAFPQASGPGSQAGGAANPYVRGRAIQHPAADPSLGTAQIRTPFLTRSLRGRGPAAYTALSTPVPAAEVPAQPSPQ